MKNKINIKLLSTFGALTVFTLPIISVIACSKNNKKTPPETKPKEKDSSTKEKDSSTKEKENPVPKPPVVDGNKLINLEPTKYQLFGNNSWYKISNLKNTSNVLLKELTNILEDASNQWYENGKPIHYTMTFDIDDTWFLGIDTTNPNHKFHWYSNLYKKGFSFTASYDISKDDKGNFVIKPNDNENRLKYKEIIDIGFNDPNNVFVTDLSQGYIQDYDLHLNCLSLTYEKIDSNNPWKFSFRILNLKKDKTEKWINEELKYSITKNENDTESSKFFINTPLYINRFKNVNAKVSIKQVLNSSKN